MTVGLDEEQKNALQEVCNVAMGAAGESLAAFTGALVELSIPQIQTIEPRELTVSLTELGVGENVSAMAQSFHFAEVECFALVVATEHSIAELCNQKIVETDAQCSQLLIDFCRAITDVCLTRLGELMSTEIDKAAAYTVVKDIPVADLVFNEILSWHRLWAIEINYHLENHPFSCDLVILIPDILHDHFIAVLERLLIE
ncbi:hypothetical protein [Halioxenophilus sp. WMMB6]|uniref:hypothetical protein n=1 Tax=Halioxenophilus sp. WMMB6 TaxID=3073815 RepID=UPI00295E9314|nr:hypothetical protein [Halioxenophilus sp. WMMB6]